MKIFKFPFLALVLSINHLFSQDYEQKLKEIQSLYDNSSVGQTFFVEDLLKIAGYKAEKIQIYQTLPNNARVFRVKLDSVSGGFIFVRWDKDKSENYIDNKLIDPGIYFNLNAAREIMRKQTEKANFGVDDVAIQAPDQEQIGPEQLNQFREEFKLKEEEKKSKELDSKKVKADKKKNKNKDKKVKKEEQEEKEKKEKNGS
ncbi:MAG: hypothetical protein CMC91_06340 [Flavobacteriaceae bacterium]|nr:hypothetical protein [Flavobacteriaceae bacterium]|tara:strand:+ start:6246 stop:6848 length:603 start_codon:yes stop_codon:yes gene_type:complete